MITATKNKNRRAISTMSLPSYVYDDSHARHKPRQRTKHAVRPVQIKSRKPSRQRHWTLGVGDQKEHSDIIDDFVKRPRLERAAANACSCPILFEADPSACS